MFKVLDSGSNTHIRNIRRAGLTMGFAFRLVLPENSRKLEPV